MDFQINRWANEHDLLLIDVKFTQESTSPRIVKEGNTEVWERVTTNTYVVLYEACNPESFDYEHTAGSEERAPAMPLKEGAKAPTVEITAVERGVSRPAMAMAGIFGVPEGYKLNPGDEEPAPIPLFSPNLDLKSYGKLFGNVGIVEVKNESKPACNANASGGPVACSCKRV
jgi:hypothetical protein